MYTEDNLRLILLHPEFLNYQIKCKYKVLINIKKSSNLHDHLITQVFNYIFIYKYHMHFI